MFERFSKPAKMVVVTSVHLARRGGEEQVAPGHLLLALLEQQGPATAALRACGLDVDPEQIRQELRQELESVDRRAGLTEADSSALREIGVDVEAIVAHVEQALGAGALAPQRRTRGARRLLAAPFSDPAKQTLVLSLRQASALNSGSIEEIHLLLGLLVEPGAVQDVLARHGVTYRQVREQAERAA